MDTVELWKCTACRLIWVRQDEEHCPRCRKDFTVPKGPVVIAGQEIPVTRVLEFACKDGLLDRDVRRGLDTLKLGCRCSHGYISSLICPICNQSLRK